MTANQQMENHNNWITKVTKKYTTNTIIKKREMQKEAIGNTRQDESRPVLEQLMNEGYDTVTWDSSNSKHSVCRELNNQQWNLQDFLSGLQYDAPIFEKTHPGDVNCFLIVTGPNLPLVNVNSYGLM